MTKLRGKDMVIKRTVDTDAFDIQICICIRRMTACELDGFVVNLICGFFSGRYVCLGLVSRTYSSILYICKIDVQA